MADTVYAYLSWDFGAEEEEVQLTAEKLFDLVKYGKKDGKREVTSILIFTETTQEYKDRMGALPVENGKLLNEPNN
jgi:hypothetical protein